MKRIFQILTALIRNLKWKAVRVFVTHPLYVLPTIRATIESVLLSEKYFDDDPDGNGPANAFRHSVWNMLIAHYCSKIYSDQKSVRWAAEITDLHEDLFVNDTYNRNMDLHNNLVGRQLFLESAEKGIRSKQQRIRLVLKRSETAAALTDDNEFRNFPGCLVYHPAEV